MIQSYLIGPTTLLANDSPVSFDRDCIRTRDCSGCDGWLCHNEGSPLYKIVKGGRYKIEFNANVSSATAGTVALGLYVDGLPIQSAIATTEITTAGNYENISFTKVITICCKASSTITVGSVPSVLQGTTPAPVETEIPILQNSNLVVTRLS